MDNYLLTRAGLASSMRTNRTFTARWPILYFAPNAPPGTLGLEVITGSNSAANPTLSPLPGAAVPAQSVRRRGHYGIRYRNRYR